MADNNHLNHLLSSSAYKSLNAEVALSKYIQSLGWKTVQGPYYKDVATDKFRELDIFARRHWKHKKNDDLTINICLLVEVKSLSNTDIIFSKFGDTNENMLLINDFIGHESTDLEIETIGNISNRKSRIALLLAKKGFDKKTIEDIFKKVQKGVFPNDMSIFADLPSTAPILDVNSCSFRELSGKNEKELDNSVLWRANMALISSATSANERSFQNNLDDLDIYCDIANSGETPPVSFLSDEILNDARRMSLLHPIIVVDSKLWMAGDNDIKPIKWCRFIQNNFFGHVKWWVDVVNYEHHVEYIDLISSRYSADFSKRMKESRL